MQVSRFKEIDKLITKNAFCCFLVPPAPNKNFNMNIQKPQRVLCTLHWCAEVGCMSETRTSFNTPVWVYHPADLVRFFSDLLNTDPTGLLSSPPGVYIGNAKWITLRSGDHRGPKCHHLPFTCCLSISLPLIPVLRFTFNRPSGGRWAGVGVGGGVVSWFIWTDYHCPFNYIWFNN